MMLNKLTNLPTLFRLTLCLVTSAGIHGGVAFYGQASRPAVAHDNSSAVVVALIETADEPALAIADKPQNVVQQAAVAAEPRAQVNTHQPTAPSRPPVVASTPASLSPDVMHSKSTTPVIEPVAGGASAEPACVETPQDLAAQPAVADLPRGEVEAEQQTGAADPLVVAAEAGPSPGKLVEATPNYRNNPLPEYPSLARQRHWEGVVWLLVDVSAEGLVDDVDVERSCGYRVLDRAASKTVKDWEFTPATRAGLPIESRVRIPVRFSLEES